VGKTVAFFCGQLGLRGAETAVFDFAHYNETLLGNRSLILSPAAAEHTNLAAFRARFPVFLYEGDFSQAQPILTRERVDCLYAIKPGFRDGVESRECRTAVHCAFGFHEPHGDAYAYISPFLAELCSDGRQPWVPLIVQLPSVEGDLRAELGIPRDALVFGRHGAPDCFDLPFVQEVVEKVARLRPEIYFVFLNTDTFCASLANVIHLPPTLEVERKVRFIQTCDGMLHARLRGENFGLAVAEFSALNRPVLTYGDPRFVPEQAHLEFLGDKAIRYSSGLELFYLLTEFRPDPTRDWNAYRDCAPERVMQRFAEVFLGSSA